MPATLFEQRSSSDFSTYHRGLQSWIRDLQTQWFKNCDQPILRSARLHVVLVTRSLSLYAKQRVLLRALSDSKQNGIHPVWLTMHAGIWSANIPRFELTELSIKILFKKNQKICANSLDMERPQRARHTALEDWCATASDARRQAAPRSSVQWRQWWIAAFIAGKISRYVRLKRNL